MDTNMNIPQGPAPQTTPPPVRPKRSRTKVIGLTAVGLVAALVILLVGSELFFRNHVENCLAEGFKNGAKANSVEATLSKQPMLLQRLGGKLPSVDIQADGLDGVDGLSAHILLKGVEASGDNRIDDATIVGTFTTEGIKNKILAIGAVTDPKVTMNSSANQIEISGSALVFPFTVNLKPTLKNNKVEVTASKTSVLGFGLPDDLVQQLISSVADIPTPNGLTAENLTMTDSGVSVTYTGTNVLPKDIESGTVDAPNCSTL